MLKDLNRLVAADQQDDWNLDSNDFISSRTHNKNISLGV